MNIPKIEIFRHSQRFSSVRREQIYVNTLKRWHHIEQVTHMPHRYSATIDKDLCEVCVSTFKCAYNVAEKFSKHYPIFLFLFCHLDIAGRKDSAGNSTYAVKFPSHSSAYKILKRKEV